MSSEECLKVYRISGLLDSLISDIKALLRDPETSDEFHIIHCDFGESEDEAAKRYLEEYPEVDRNRGTWVFTLKFSDPSIRESLSEDKKEAIEEAEVEPVLQDLSPAEALDITQEPDVKAGGGVEKLQESQANRPPQNQESTVEDQPQHRLHRILDRIDGRMDNSREIKKFDNVISFRRREPSEWDWMR